VTDASVQKQIEFYLSDANLARDKFFREQIQTDKEGWVSIAHFLNCNKVKAMGISSERIANSCADSTLVEVSNDKTKVRRKDNASLPAFNADRKRDFKAAGKLGGGGADRVEED